MIRRSLLVAASLFLFGCGGSSSTPTGGGFGSATPESIDSIVADAMSAQHIPGVAVSVVKDGQIVYTKGYGQANVANNTPMTASTPLQVGSCTKTLTAVSVLMIYDNPGLITKSGITKLDLDAGIGTYLDNEGDFVLPDAWKGFTVRQVLSMTSGIPDGSSNTAPWTQIIKNADGKVAFSPAGSCYLYSNLGFMILGELVTQLSGTEYETFVSQHIFQPLGMNNSYLPTGTTLPSGAAIGYNWTGTAFEATAVRDPQSSFSSGALVTTAEDFGKWTQALMTGKLLSTDAFTQMLAPQEIANGSAHFGLGWAVSVPSLGIFQKDGGLPGISAFIACYRNQGVAVTVQTNLGDADVADLAHNIVSEVAGETVTYPIAPPTDCTPADGLAADCTDKSLSVG